MIAWSRASWTSFARAAGSTWRTGQDSRLWSARQPPEQAIEYALSDPPWLVSRPRERMLRCLASTTAGTL